MVRNTTAAVDPATFRRFATSRPPIPGIEISRTMTSGCNLSAASSAVRPSLTAPTISNPEDNAAAAVSSMSTLSSTRRTLGCSDNVVPDCISNEFRRGLDVELLHHLILVKGDGPWCQFQHSGHGFHRVSFRQQLENLPLP